MIVAYVDFESDRILQTFGPDPAPQVPREKELVQVPDEAGFRFVVSVEWETVRTVHTTASEVLAEDRRGGYMVAHQKARVMLSRQRGGSR